MAFAALSSLSISVGAVVAQARSPDPAPTAAAVSGLLDLEASGPRSSGEFKVAARVGKVPRLSRSRHGRDDGAKEDGAAASTDEAPAAASETPPRASRPVVTPATAPVPATPTGLDAAPAGCYAGCGTPPGTTVPLRAPAAARSATKPALRAQPEPAAPVVATATPASHECFAGCGTNGPVAAARLPTSESEMRATAAAPSGGQVRVLRGVTRSKVYGVPN